MEPVLALLNQGAAERPLKFIHRVVRTREKFVDYLGQWARRGANYPILILAFHGEPGLLYVGARRKTNVVTLDDLATIVGDKLRGRLVHLSACSALDVEHRRIRRFLKRTGAVAATGFREDVEWLKSSAFEVMLLDIFLQHPLTRAGARRMARSVRRELPELRRELRFRLVVNET
jgi:hypothetical protein